MKKIVLVLLTLSLLVGAFASCGDASAQITVVTREESSGTRSAFVELLGITVEQNGEEVDGITPTAVQQRSTSTVRTTVAGEVNAIGYISLGSLDDSVKAIKVDGVEASVDNILNGSYKVARPFNIVTKGEADAGLEADFIRFIMSAEGQKILTDEGYIAADSNAASYQQQEEGFSGRLAIGGSTSVGPVMLKLTEAYSAIYPEVEFDVQQNGSGTGISDAISGNVDIGMASREVADSELAEGLVATTIATDGIAVIVNLDSSIDSLTSEQIKNIYLGEITSWDEIG